MTTKAAFREVYSGFKSLLIGMRITLGQAFKPIITVQYPRQTLKMPARFRGHIQLVLDPETGKSRCTACKLCERACPSDCIAVEGAKREGQKTKSVTDYILNFTTCSLCGSCIEVCPFDAIEFSKDYNVVAFSRDAFNHMDLVQRLAARREVWAQNRPLATAPEPIAPTPAVVAAPASQPQNPEQKKS
jgi:NADH-quinone oxidoreductase subunit I